MQEQMATLLLENGVPLYAVWHHFDFPIHDLYSTKYVIRETAVKSPSL